MFQKHKLGKSLEGNDNVEMHGEQSHLSNTAKWNAQETSMVHSIFLKV